MTTPTQIRSLVRRQILFALEDDLKGGELLMKEVWEQCEAPEDAATAEHELREIIEVLRSREAAEARSWPLRVEMTAPHVEKFMTYPLDVLLDELVTCTVRYNLGNLDADDRRVATAVLERLAVLGIARKVHREGCDIWPEHQLCRCPWSVTA